MNRTKKLKLNTVIALFNRFAILISGLILPRFILLYYGSEINGLVQSIRQFLSIITFLDLGVGSVIQAALYRPLAEKNKKKISQVMIGAKNYFRKIAYALILYVIGLIIFYPLLLNSSVDYLSTAFLIFGLSLNIFGQYYFGITNELLLNADQKNYIQLSSEIIVSILNLLISIVLIKLGSSIQLVKIASGLIFLIRPIYLSYYVKSNYKIDLKTEITEDPLPQKWSGVGQHVAYTIQNSTDVVVLTIFSSLDNVSIYSVYKMIVNAVNMLLTSLTDGINSFFGNLLATEEYNLLDDYFSKIEWLIHTLSIYLFGLTTVLINSFVAIYTAGIEDVNYQAPLFSFLLILGNIIYAIRIPYRRLVFAAGHFKQTQAGSYVEAILNVTISVLLVTRFGIVGVAIGTLVSMGFQTIYLVVYNSKNILYRPIRKFAKHVIVDLIMYVFMLLAANLVFTFISITTLLEWIIVAILLGIIFMMVVVIINRIFYREILHKYINRISVWRKK